MISFLFFTVIILQKKKIMCLYAITCVSKENAQIYVTTLLEVSFFIKINTWVFLFRFESILTPVHRMTTLAQVDDLSHTTRGT